MRKQPQRTQIHYGWFILAAVVLAVFASLGLGRFGYSAILPSMQAGLSLNNTQTGVLATANLIGYVAMAAAGGALAARFGPRIVVTLGLLLAALGMLLTGTASGFGMAIVWRAVTGIGSGASNAPAMGLLSSWFGSRRRGMAAGIGVMGSSFALIILGSLVPFILDAFGGDGWRTCWYVLGTITLAVAVIVFLVLRNHPRDKGLRMLGEDTGRSDVVEPDEDPLHWGSVYRSPSVWLLGSVYTAYGFAYIIYMTYFVKFLIKDGGYTTSQAGGMFMLVGWLSLACGLIWGTVSDRIGRARTLFIVYFLQAIAFGLFALGAKPWGFVISAVLFGLTAWSIPAIMSAACGDMLNPRMAPAAYGFITVFMGAGQALGPTVAGKMADFSGSFSSSFLLAAAVALIGAFGSLLIKASSQSRSTGR